MKEFKYFSVLLLVGLLILKNLLRIELNFGCSLVYPNRRGSSRVKAVAVLYSMPSIVLDVAMVSRAPTFFERTRVIL
ncbi:hypothetical protein D3C77_263750 [compost metagenome]